MVTASTSNKNITFFMGGFVIFKRSSKYLVGADFLHFLSGAEEGIEYLYFDHLIEVFSVHLSDRSQLLHSIRRENYEHNFL